MALNELNSINISGWKDDPNVSVEIARAIEKASWKKSPFEPLVGKGGDRGIRSYTIKDNAPYRPRLKAQLTGEGVKGNADFDTNFDNLEILSQTIYPEIVGNALKSPVKHYSVMQQVDFVKESSDSLTDWITDKRDRRFCTALLNDLTNVVVADSTKGFKDTSAEPSTQEACKKVAKGDVVSVRAIRRAIFMARSGLNYKGKESFPIKPIRSETSTEGGITITNYSYIIFLDSYGINQLKHDAEWVEMQKVGVRGDKNRLFTGLVGVIDECPVIDMGVWTNMQAGLLNSEVSDNAFKANINAQNFTRLTPPSQYAGSAPVSIGFLVGASALVMAGSTSLNFYIDDTQDAGRKTICGVDRLFAVSKGRFEHTQPEALSPYANTDFAVIGIAYSKE